jgi:hypothetical protein
MYMRNLEGQLVAWERCRIRSLQALRSSSDRTVDRDEKFLENVIASQPELLGIGSSEDDTDIEGPFVAFSQIGLKALNDRIIYPDLVLLWQSGHVVVVEVKLIDNPELRDRQVVAQLLEYAAVLSSCSESKLVQLFRGDPEHEAWPQLVGRLFPGAMDPERLAKRLLDKFRSSRLHLVIACDEAPKGLKELVRGVVGQSALGEYNFRVVEVMAYASDRGVEDVLFMPHTALSTEIIGRTSVTVSIAGQQGSADVTVQVTPLEEQEAAARELRDGNPVKRVWTEESFFEDAQARTDAGTFNALREFVTWAKTSGWELRMGSGKETGTISMIIPSISERSALAVYSDGLLMINLANLPDSIAARLRSILLSLPQVSFTAVQYPSLRPATWVPNSESIREHLSTIASGGTAPLVAD